MSVSIEQMSLEELRHHPKYAGTDGLDPGIKAVHGRVLELERLAGDAEKLAELETVVEPGLPGDLGHTIGQLPGGLRNRLDEAGVHRDDELLAAGDERGGYLRRREAIPPSTRARFKAMAEGYTGKSMAAASGGDKRGADGWDARAAAIYSILGVLP
jgi:hypothetical protein